MRRKMVTVILAILIVTGCAPPQWKHPGVEKSVYNSDREACRRSSIEAINRDPDNPYAGDPSGYNPVSTIDTITQIYKFSRCMKEKGYE